MASHTMGLLGEPRRRRTHGTTTAIDSTTSIDRAASRSAARTPGTSRSTRINRRSWACSSRPAAHYPFFAPSAAALPRRTRRARGHLGRRRRTVCTTESWKRRRSTRNSASCQKHCVHASRGRWRAIPRSRWRLRDFVARLPPRVGAVAAESGLSRRRFIEVFVEEVGVTPKLYLRLARFNRVLGCVFGTADVDWAEIAYLHGYADQSHFNREFREFAGLTPSQYLARPGQGAGHAELTPRSTDAVLRAENFFKRWRVQRAGMLCDTRSTHRGIR